MKARVKQQWLRALRSGRYKQGQNRLRTNKDGFCCLGVLCDVYNKGLKRSQWRQTVDFKEWAFGKAMEESSLPPAVQRWAGLTSDDPVLNNPEVEGHSTCASQCNDNLKYSFKRIAKLIEKNL